MNVVVINGSPSGNRGTTAQFVAYLRAKLGEHDFVVVEAARKIAVFERDPTALDKVVAQLRSADVVLWAYPVYVMLVPAQMLRFVELVAERVGPGGLEGRLASALSTSAHHYDHTAIDWMRDVSTDLGMSWMHGFSAGSADLPTPSGQHDLLGFATEILATAAEGTTLEVPAPRVPTTMPTYIPEPWQVVTGQPTGKMVIIDDGEPGDHNLDRMIRRLSAGTTMEVDRLRLANLDMKGGCRGCMRCADNGRCVIRDGYSAAFAERVLEADVVIYAGAVRQRFLSARMKAFIDRYFENGHRPLLDGKLVGFLVSGPLAQLTTLREVLESHVEVGHCQRLGIVTDENPDSEVTSTLLDTMARKADRWLEHPWHRPRTFRGVGADKNFRDLVYANRGILTADHHYYRRTDLYDFPQRQIGRWLFNAFLLVCKRIPVLRDRIAAQAASGKIRSHRKLLEAIQAES